VAGSAVNLNRGGYGMGVAIYGLRDTKKALTQFAPDLRKEMDGTIRQALEPVKARAAGAVPASPMSGWSRGSGNSKWSGVLGWDAGEVRRGIKILQGGRGRRGSGVQVAWKIASQAAPGIVLEVARQSKRPNFIANLDRFASPSRLIWQAWDDLGGDEQLTPKVVDAIQTAERALEARLAAASDPPER
jgi:hypothetical protein